ncbi:indolepyruvate ferredoxin oxidoreductase family protein [Alphaproteobacteria bacterium]|nr:indolepyruvate ferredoxin oxidoreductase family protein [Alphaproteobacteria bacterium]
MESDGMPLYPDTDDCHDDASSISTSISLADKYDLAKHRVFLTGTQAIIRLCQMQATRDRVMGLDTGGYITGYRGSPLGGLDQQLAAAKEHLDSLDVLFQPALNEDLAATAIWGSQQVSIRGEGKKDGVFALWYGKGPGVDRSGDVFRHGNLAGSAEKGGVLALLGDDHSCESSTTCHQSEYALVDAMMPVLNPANIDEIIAYGLHGWAMSRVSGLWVGLKCVKDNIESSGSILLPASPPAPIYPDIDLPPGGVNIRAADDRHEQERRLHRYKLDAARAYARVNHIDGVKWSGGVAPKIGIISTGKSWMDTESALALLELNEARAAEMGLATYKVGMVWPLESEGLKDFALGLDQLIVVEEKRGLIEGQAREILYGLEDAPQIIGKHNEVGDVLFPADGVLDPVLIAKQLALRLPRLEEVAKRLLLATDDALPPLGVARTPYFCAGCPHNSSTVLPDGARGYAGIGCHWMSQMMDRDTEGYTQMGGEGANWIGEAPFSSRKHVFQNLGDGTYNHSGLMAIRAAIAANVNITYKILYNDAVAMTGGQMHEGGLPPAQIAAEVLAAGAMRVDIVTDQPKDFDTTGMPADLRVHHRDDLQSVQRALADIAGVTVLLYVQTCATEKRRRRKRGLVAESTVRVMINPDVCEGCGDCGVQSNCVAILPLETPLGTKRAIDQSACNKDVSCLKGFCPSFVTIEGGQLRKPAVDVKKPSDLPAPKPVLNLDTPKSILITGVGGTGVVTLGALLGMAAHIEGKGVGVIDMAGLAQKGGAVTTHLRLAATPDQIKAIRIAPGKADLMLGSDLLTSAGREALSLLRPDAHIIANTHEMMTGAFVRDRNFTLPSTQMQARLQAAVPTGQSLLTNATEMARQLLGDTIGANLFLLGVAWQRGLIPLSETAIIAAIRLNKVAIDFNIAAFGWGRVFAVDPARLTIHNDHKESIQRETCEDIITDRATRLAAYQNRDYAKSFQDFVAIIRDADFDPSFRLTKAVAKTLFKLMAYKDEYEVARQLTNPDFERSIAKQFDGDFRVIHHLAPPALGGVDAATGRPRKRRFGRWVRPVLRLLAHGKCLRRSWADPFGYTVERRMERALITDYQAIISQIIAHLGKGNYDTAVELAETPDQIRGFGPVKMKAMKAAKARQAELINSLRNVADISV